MRKHWLAEFVPGFEFMPLRSVDDLRQRDESPFVALNTDLPQMASTYTVSMRSGSPTPSAEIYVPSSDGLWPVFMHIHGGAWYSGSAEGERKLAMQIASAGFVVVNVDYARTPEHPFPGGLEDCLYAARWIASNIKDYSGDPARLAIGGGSAGGNLTAATTLALHGSDEGLGRGDLAGVDVKVAAAVLEFGVFNGERWLADDPYASDVEIYYQALLGPDFRQRLSDPRVSPAYSTELALMPPTYLSCGAYDCLLGNSLEMTTKLANADVPTTLSVVENVDHEFLKLPHARAQNELHRITDWVHAHVSQWSVS